MPNTKFTWRSKWKLSRSALISTVLTSLAFGIPLSMMRAYRSQGFIYVGKGSRGPFTATGSEALIEIYGLFAVFSAMWLTAVYYLFQCGKKIWKGEYASAFPFQIGNHKVAVTCKETKLWTVRSLSLQFQNGQQALFHCTTDKIAASLLNDFSVGEKASLVIKSEDGSNCELIANKSYAHGMITLLEHSLDSHS